MTAGGFRETVGRTRGLNLLNRLGGEPSVPEDVHVTAPGSRAPRVSFNRSTTPHRRVGFASLPFDEVHAIKEAGGTTVHDVVMAICAGGVRRWLEERNELPSAPLLAAVPVLVRSAENDRADHVSMMIAALPTQEADPVKRLARAHDAMRAAKERHDAVPADLLQDMTRYAPPAVAGLAARLVGAISIGEIASPPFNLAISNVPGPRHAVYCGGARLVANHPLSIISTAVSLHISFVSYDDMIHLGVVSCREALPSTWELVDHIEAALHELSAAVAGG